MSNKVVNLTQLIVEQELDTLLEMYPHKLHKLELTNPDLRQELLAYVLNRIPNFYVTKSNLESQNSSFSSCSEEQQMQIKDLVFQGINYFTPVKRTAKICA